MGKTAMPIIWFFTKKSSVVSERLNTPVLNIVVHLEFHSNFVKISYVCLDKLETIKYTKGKQEMYEYFKVLTRLSLKDIENILENNRIVKKR